MLSRGGVPKIARQIVIVRFQRSQDLPAECFGGLLALVVQDEMATLTLSEIGFCILLALRLRQILLDVGIGPQLE